MGPVPLDFVDLSATTLRQVYRRVDEDSACELIANNYWTVFIGSGVSGLRGTDAPSAAAVIELTLDRLCAIAQIRLIERENRKRTWGGSEDTTAPKIQVRDLQPVLPESCYSAIATATGSADHLHIWRTFGWCGGPNDDAPQPNLAHYFAIQAAARSGSPLLTTNFDYYLERAAENLGMECKVGLPTQTGFDSVAAPPEGVALWKLHGTANEAETLRSHASDLARDSVQSLMMQESSLSSSLLLLGYSGRDFDVFPVLMERFRGKQILWVDPDQHHRARAIQGIAFYHEDTVALCSRILGTWRTEQQFYEPLRDYGPEYAQILQGAVEASINSKLISKAQARATLARILVTICEFDAATEILQDSEMPDSLKVMASIDEHLCLESMDRHEDAYDVAIEQRRRSIGHLDLLGAARSELAAAYSDLRCQVAAFDRPTTRSDRSDPASMARVTVRMIVDVFVGFPLAIAGYVKTRTRQETQAYFNLLDYLSEYDEHLIRVASIVGGIMDLLNQGLSAKIQRPIWGLMIRVCSSSGYLRGVLNARKFLGRVRGGSSSADARFASEVVGDLLARSIAIRDEAIVDQRAERFGQGRSFEASMSESLQDAMAVNSPVLVLKVLLAWSNYSAAPLPMADVDIQQWLQRLQGDADRGCIDSIAGQLLSKESGR